jgi:hypothetical protein
MLGWFQRPRLEATFTPTHATTDEFARTLELAGRIVVRNHGSEAQLGETEMIVIAGFRRISLEVPNDWRALALGHGMEKAGDVGWSLTLDAPLRAEKGELYFGTRDQKRKKWEWRLPFTFEQR